MVKNPPANSGDAGLIPGGQEDPMEKEIATHSSILAWEIPWTEEPGRLESMWSQKSQTWLSGYNNKDNLLTFQLPGLCYKNCFLFFFKFF